MGHGSERIGQRGSSRKRRSVDWAPALRSGALIGLIAPLPHRWTSVYAKP